MRAMQYVGYGDPTQLRMADVPVPKPAPEELLVRVAASSVNPVDWKLYNGSLRYLVPMKFPGIPGFDIAGEVVEVGKQVEQFKAGDRVYASLDSKSGGAAAEYASVGAQAAAPLPKTMGYQRAALIPLAGLTALQALRDKGRLRSGQRCLIVGAAGGVGHLAVQIGKALGAHVTGVCSTANVALVKELGADQVIDYTKQSDFQGDGGYDVLLDAVGTLAFAPFKAAMNPEAIYITLLPRFASIARALCLPFYSKQRVVPFLMRPKGDDLRYLAELIERSQLRAIVDSTFKLEDLAEGHQRSQSGRVTGKIKVLIGQA